MRSFSADAPSKRFSSALIVIGLLVMVLAAIVFYYETIVETEERESKIPLHARPRGFTYTATTSTASAASDTQGYASSSEKVVASTAAPTAATTAAPTAATTAAPTAATTAAPTAATTAAPTAATTAAPTTTTTAAVPTTAITSAPTTTAMASSTTASLLRHAWSRPIHSELAQQLATNQQNCSRPQYQLPPGTQGFGCDLHMWTQALFNAHSQGGSLVTFGDWKWEDQRWCSPGSSDFLSCYWSNTRPCPVQATLLSWNQLASKNPEADTPATPQSEHDITERRVAGIEYLFSSVSARIIGQAEKAVKTLFGPLGAPEDMITVFIRWSDKGREGGLVSMDKYIEAVNSLVIKHQIDQPCILVTSEDVNAIAAFQNAKKVGWRVVHFTGQQFDPGAREVHELDGQAPVEGIDEWSGNYVNYSMEEKESLFFTFGPEHTGLQGAWSLVTLLLSMESKYYVLTLSSNWCRLIDELRKSIVDVDCDGCTEMVDLHHHWVNDW